MRRIVHKIETDCHVRFYRLEQTCSHSKTKTGTKQEQCKRGMTEEGRYFYLKQVTTASSTRTQNLAHGHVPWSGKCKCGLCFHGLIRYQASLCQLFQELLLSPTLWKFEHCFSPDHMWTLSKGTSSLYRMLWNQCSLGTILRLCNPLEHLIGQKQCSVSQHQQNMFQ